MFTYIKILFFNLAAIFSIIGALVTFPILFQYAFDFYQKHNPLIEDGNILSSNFKLDKRFLLENYESHDWAEKHFIEIQEMTSSYYDFVVWKRDQFKGETINIDDEGFRYTLGSKTNDIHDIWMFGGSTLWGSGSKDEFTIPSYLSQISGLKVRNYGMGGWVVRQELNQLIHEYAKINEQEKIKERIIIFYDGANDGSAHCRLELQNDISTNRESQIRDVMKEYTNNKSAIFSWKYLFDPATEFIKKIKNKFYSPQNIIMEKDEWWICDKDPRRAEQIARAIVNDWIYASNIAEINNDKFLAILQPVAHLSNSPLDHLSKVGMDAKLTNERTRQYEAIYPLIEKYAKQANINFFNLESVLDVNEYVYIDQFHLSPNGNLIMAKEINKIIELLGAE